MRELVPDNPMIVCFTSLDPGLYYLTDTYPPDKYFCRYNLFTPRELGYYEKYIETGKTDFVIAYTHVDDLEEYGYELYYEEHDVPKMDGAMTINTLSYYLLKMADCVVTKHWNAYRVSH